MLETNGTEALQELSLTLIDMTETKGATEGNHASSHCKSISGYTHSELGLTLLPRQQIFQAEGLDSDDPTSRSSDSEIYERKCSSRQELRVHELDRPQGDCLQPRHELDHEDHFDSESFWVTDGPLHGCLLRNPSDLGFRLIATANEPASFEYTAGGNASQESTDRPTITKAADPHVPYTVKRKRGGQKRKRGERYTGRFPEAANFPLKAVGSKKKADDINSNQHGNACRLEPVCRLFHCCSDEHNRIVEGKPAENCKPGWLGKVIIRLARPSTHNHGESTEKTLPILLCHTIFFKHLHFRASSTGASESRVNLPCECKPYVNNTKNSHDTSGHFKSNNFESSFFNFNILHTIFGELYNTNLSAITQPSSLSIQQHSFQASIEPPEPTDNPRIMSQQPHPHPFPGFQATLPAGSSNMPFTNTQSSAGSLHSVSASDSHLHEENQRLSAQLLEYIHRCRNVELTCNQRTEQLQKAKNVFQGFHQAHQKRGAEIQWLKEQLQQRDEQLRQRDEQLGAIRRMLQNPPRPSSSHFLLHSVLPGHQDGNLSRSRTDSTSANHPSGTHLNYTPENHSIVQNHLPTLPLPALSCSFPANHPSFSTRSFVNPPQHQAQHMGTTQPLHQACPQEPAFFDLTKDDGLSTSQSSPPNHPLITPPSSSTSANSRTSPDDYAKRIREKPYEWLVKNGRSHPNDLQSLATSKRPYQAFKPARNSHVQGSCPPSINEPRNEIAPGSKKQRRPDLELSEAEREAKAKERKKQQNKDYRAKKKAEKGQSTVAQQGKKAKLTSASEEAAITRGTGAYVATGHQNQVTDNTDQTSSTEVTELGHRMEVDDHYGSSNQQSTNHSAQASGDNDFDSIFGDSEELPSSPPSSGQQMPTVDDEQLGMLLLAENQRMDIERQQNRGWTSQTAGAGEMDARVEDPVDEEEVDAGLIEEMEKGMAEAAREDEEAEAAAQAALEAVAAAIVDEESEVSEEE